MRSSACQLPNGGFITQALYDQVFFCENCGAVVPEGDVITRNGGYYCSACGPGKQKQEQDPDGAYSYVTKVQDILGYPDYPRTHRCFGVELECEPAPDQHGSFRAALSAAWPITAGEGIWKQDSSLTGGGLELATQYHPLRFWQGDNFLQELLEDAGFRRAARSHATTTCGLHVHVSRASMLESTVAKLVVLLNEPSAKSLLGQIARRSMDSTPCRAYKKKWIWRGYVPDQNKQFNQGLRDTPVNLTEGTIEFRIFRGTLHWPTLLASVEFCDAAVTYASTHGPSMMTGPRFATWLQTRPRRAWPALADYLVRRGIKPAKHNPTTKEIKEL
jgi:hypothetical protein